jgi:hypothetical protein
MALRLKLRFAYCVYDADFCYALAKHGAKTQILLLNCLIIRGVS